MPMMKDDELIAIARQELEVADTQGTNAIKQQRLDSYSIYVNQQIKDYRASTGLSSAWLNEHFDYTERLTMLITKGIVGDPDVVSLSTNNPQLVPVAKQSQDCINWALMRNNNGYKVINRQVKDACIQKVGVTKVFWDETPIVWQEEVDTQGQPIDNFINMKMREMGDDMEIKTVGKPRMVVDETIVQDFDDEDEVGYEEIEEQVVSSIYTLEYRAPRGLVWENVPREEFIANTELVSLDDELCRFVAHRRKVMLGDVVSMYPDVIKKIQRRDGEPTMEDAALQLSSDGGSIDNWDWDFERINRFSWDGSYNVTQGQESPDPMTRRVLLVESYHRVDYKGDGKLVWVKLVWAGHEILEKMVVEDHPFTAFSVFPIPHKFDGQSIFDVINLTMKSMTGLLRSKIDNSIQRNIVRIVGNKKHIDDRGFQQGKPGVVHVKNNYQGAVQFLETPAGANDTVPILQYLDQKISAKIGISSINSGTNVDLLKSGNDAAKVQTVQSQAAYNLEMYIREFCETNLRDVVWKAFKLLQENAESYYVQNALKKLYPPMQQMGPMPQGQPMMAPKPVLYAAQDGISDYFDKADFVATVGLGHMGKDEKLQALTAAHQVIQSLPAQGIPVPPNKVMKLAEDTLKALGLYNAMDYMANEQELQMFMQNQQQQQQVAQQQQAAAAQLEMQNKAADTRAKEAKALKDETDASLMKPEFDLKVIQTEAEIQYNKDPKFQ